MASLQQVEEKLSRLERIQSAANSQANSLTVSAGGVGVWICATGCAVMFVMNLFLGMIVFDLKRQLDDVKDYQTATYMMAPNLKPKDYK